MPRHVVGLLAFGPALLLVASALQLGAYVQSQGIEDEERRDLAAQKRLDRTLRVLVDAETGQRGYLLTGDERYLEPYDAAVRTLQYLPDRDASRQTDPRLQELDRLAAAKLEELAGTIALERAGNHEGALAIVESGRGKKLLDDMRKLVAELEAVEQSRLSDHNRREATVSRLALFATEFSIILVLGIGGFLLLAAREMRRHLELCIADLQRFAARAAHDIRNPLAAIDLRIDAAKQGVNDQEALEDLERAQTTLRTVATLVDGLLDFAKTSERFDEESEAEVAAVVRGVVAATQHTASDHGVTLSIGELCASFVACSPGVLTSIVFNLVDNAIKHIGRGLIKNVTVEATSTGAKTLIEVRDTGPGIPNELQRSIFEPSVRAAQAWVPGLGIGLSTVRRLALAHGGAAGVRSDLPVGSVFWVELPNASKRRGPSVVRHAWKPSLWMMRRPG